MNLAEIKYTIGKVAMMSAVSADTLRHYEKKGPDCADIENRRRLSPLQRERRAPHPLHQTGPVLRINAIRHQAIVDAEVFG